MVNVSSSYASSDALLKSMKVKGKVNTKKAGTYKVQCTITDPYTAVSVTKTFTFKVGKKPKQTTTEKKEETTTEKKEETTTEKKEETTTEKKEETTENPDEGKNYKNGTYKVSVSCEPDEDEDFDPYTISMDITIKKDKITEISNITANTNSTNKAYTNDAKKGMVSKIIANGNADGVNTVAGATCSSKAIKDACQKAFNAAKK